MSIASEITSIGENLKKDYQSIANLGADLTNVDKNIENIAELLDGVYDRLPKTEFEEGESVTLENTLKGKLDYDNEVVGIGQSSQESTEGYQLLNSTLATSTQGTIEVTNNGDGSYTLNGTPNSTIAVKIGDGITLENGSDYTLFVFNESTIGNTSTSGTWCDLRLSSSSGNIIDGCNVAWGTANAKVTKNITSDYTNAKVEFRIGSGITLNNFKIRPMLIKGSDTTKTYEPYTGGQASPNPSYPQEIKCVRGNQDVVVSGKNEYYMDYNDNTQTWNGVTIVSTKTGYSIKNTATQSTAYTLVSRKENLKAGSYVLKLKNTTTLDKVGLSKTDYTGIVMIRSGGQSATFSLVEDTDVCLTLGIINGTTYDEENEVMICKGTDTSTTYEPYITPTSYQLSLGDKKLYGLTNTYKDIFVTNRTTKKWYISRDIDEVVLDSTMTWNSPATHQFNVSNISPSMLASDDGSTSKCNYFTSIVSTASDSEFRNYIANNNLDNVYDIHMNGSGIRFWTTKFSTLEQFTDWLDGVNLKVLVVRPDRLTEITGTLAEQLEEWYNAHSNNGTTIITSNGDLPMIIKVRGLKGE